MRRNQTTENNVYYHSEIIYPASHEGNLLQLEVGGFYYDNNGNEWGHWHMTEEEIEILQKFHK